MRRLENKRVLALLVKAYNQDITDYFYFPDIIYAGRQKMDRADFEFLLSEELLTFSKFDSFGRYYSLSKKAHRFLQGAFMRTVKKKANPVPLTQGCLYFSRSKNVYAKDARCLLFL